MASLPNNLSGNSGYQRLALDNLLRRELKVSDPNDPAQIAQALLSRYQNDPKANAIAQEAKGLPFLQASVTPAMLAQTPSSSDAELKQAIDDVNRDLQALINNSLLKDVTPELQGWAQAVRSAMQEGTAAARFGLDPRQRDKAFSIRRQLGDYARIARFVGALTLPASQMYRKFAQSLDEVAAIMLVLMGEALANVGFSGGHFLLQTPYSELQVRRDAVISALRNLIGSTESSFHSSKWAWGLNAYRDLFELLDKQGQGDLRALLVENELSRIMDELIQRASHGNAEGLRALGSTAKLDLQRFRRLIILGNEASDPASPQLKNFLLALQLFADAFDGSGGYRLLKIARPPILHYGLYNMGEPSIAEETLTTLVMQRGKLAASLDCSAPTNNDAAFQIVLDKLLDTLDRAIDLYIQGSNPRFGEPEQRAVAYGVLFKCALDLKDLTDGALKNILLNVAAKLLMLGEGVAITPENLGDKISNINKKSYYIYIGQELNIQKKSEENWEKVATSMSPSCINNIFDKMNRVFVNAFDLINGQTMQVMNLSGRVTLPGTQEGLMDQFVNNLNTQGGFEHKSVDYEHSNNKMYALISRLGGITSDENQEQVSIESGGEQLQKQVTTEQKTVPAEKSPQATGNRGKENPK